MENKMTFRELISELRTYENCCVDAKHIIVSNLYVWLLKQEEFIDYFSQLRIKPNTDAETRKSNLKEILLAIQDSQNIYSVDELPPSRWGSIYPLRN